MSDVRSKLQLVTCVSNAEVLCQRLLRSPCVQSGEVGLSAHFNCSSAAQAFNGVMGGRPESEWLVWVHQDVYLPQGWEEQFLYQIELAEKTYSKVAVAGVYGIHREGGGVRRAGHVLDRGNLLREAQPLPCLADSLDELLFAVRVSSGLLLDEELGFDFYATDVTLQAQQAGLRSVVVDSYCEHWSDTPSRGPVASGICDRIIASAERFERKWQHRLPVTTPCFEIHHLGDVREFVRYATGLPK